MALRYPLIQIGWILFLASNTLTASNISWTKKPIHAKNTKIGVVGDSAELWNSEHNEENAFSESFSTFHNKKASFASILTDSSSVGVKVFAEVINYENSAAAYTVHLTDCSDNIPVTKTELEPAIETKLPHISKLKTKISQVYLIPPRRSQTFIIDLPFENSTTQFQGKGTCLANVMNRLNGKLATKLIIFSVGDSCICSPNCACSCHKEDGNLICGKISDKKVVSDWLRRNTNGNKNTKLPLDSIAGSSKTSGALTGDNGWMASANEKFQSFRMKALDDKHLLYLNFFLLLLIVLVFLVLGTCKGLWGICCYSVGRCGLSRFYDRPRFLTKYYEKKYSKYSVIHDSEGYPLDPLSRNRTVKRLNPYAAFFLNVIYFLCCPIFCFCGLRDDCCKSWDVGNGRGGKDEGFDDKSYLQNAFRSYRKKKSCDNPFTFENEPRGRKFADQTKDSMTRSFALLNGPSTQEEDPINSQRARFALQGSSSTEFQNMEMDDLEFRDVDDEECEEEESVHEIIIPEDKQNDLLMPPQNFVTGCVHVLPNNINNGSSTLLSPLPTSSTILQKLSREPQQWPDPHLKKSNLDKADNSNFGRPIPIPYGSWHRTPAIFNDDYEGASLFDFHQSLAASRKIEQYANQGCGPVTSKSETLDSI